jgi:hypothetical protein
VFATRANCRAAHHHPHPPTPAPSAPISAMLPLPVATQRVLDVRQRLGIANYVTKGVSVSVAKEYQRRACDEVGMTGVAAADAAAARRTLRSGRARVSTRDSRLGCRRVEIKRDGVTRPHCGDDHLLRTTACWRRLTSNSLSP